MRKRLQITLNNSNRNIDIFLTLFLCFLLSMNVTGQNIQTRLSESWTNGSWQNYSLVISTYDANDYLTNTLSQQWDNTSATWVNGTQSIYTNNSDGSPNLQIFQLWDGISTWNNYQRSTYTYNLSGKVLTKVVEKWTDGNWQNFTKNTFTYDGNGYLSTNLLQIWTSGAWENSGQIVYTNNPDGTVNQEVTTTCKSGYWFNNQKVIYVYNTSGKVLNSDFFHESDGNWQSYYKGEYTYDGNGYLINRVYQLWHQYTLYDPYSGIWFNDKQMRYVNNPDGTLIQCTTQVSEGGSPWRNILRETYIISVPTGASEIIKEESFNIYPNPAHDVITIKANKNMHYLTYSFIDLTGKVILKGKLTGESTTLDIPPLINGIYYLQFGGRNQHSYKVLINQSR